MKTASNHQEPGSSSRRWLVLVLCALLFICSQFFRVSNAIIAPQLQRDLDLSAEALGVLSAVFFYVFAATQVPMALFLDRLGARITMTALSLVGAVGAVVFAMAEGMYVAAAGRALLGIGMAGNLIGSLKLITQWFSPREFATLSGTLMALGTLGNMLAATPLALLVEGLGWRWSFVVIAVVTAVLSVLFFSLVREGPGGEGEEPAGLRAVPSIREMLGLLLTRREYWLISLGTFCRYGTILAIQGLWIGPYLMEALNLSSVAAGNLLLVLNIGLIVGSPVGGWLSDRVMASRKNVVLLGLAGMAIGELALSQGWCGSHPLALGGLLFGLGLASAFGQVMYAHIKETMPAHMSGMALTGVNLFTMLGAAAFLHGMGWVVDRWNIGRGTEGQAYEAAFFMGFLGVVVAFALYVFTREPKQKGSPPRST